MRDFADEVNATQSSARALRVRDNARREAAAGAGTVWRASESEHPEQAA